MRLEGENGGRETTVLRLVAQQRQHRLMAAMDPVEIADGQRTGRRQGCMMETAKDLHGRGLSPPSQHFSIMALPCP